MRTLYIEGNSFDPYYNLAAEELMMQKMQKEKDAVLLYLWQNEPSVVIGMNQDPLVECDVRLMLQKGCHVVRRKSGGGAVYHDLGNLNYSFIAPETAADRQKWNEIVCEAVGKYGLEAAASGRNDLVAGGRKFSGSAFRKSSGVILQHGTLMIDVKMDDVSTYLRPSCSKLQKHGIRSVEQRVVNLKELNNQISVDGMKENIKEEFRKAYLSKELFCLKIGTWIDSGELESKWKEYSSERFIYGAFTKGESADYL